MNGQPPVSIYIFTYLDTAERGDILKRTCEAALAQNYPDFEVVVSEDPGPLQAKEALASIKNPRLKHVRHEGSAGRTENMNRCLDLCSHDIIKPLCDDDLMHPDFLSRTVPLVDDNTLVFVGTEKYVLGKDPEKMQQQLPEVLKIDERNAGYRFDIWVIPLSPFPSAQLFTRKLYHGLGGYDPETPYLSDLDFMIKACLRHKIAHVNHTLCYAGVWNGSLTETKVENPYFFPTEELYTKFWLYRCHQLPPKDRVRLFIMLMGAWATQSIRLVRHIGKPRYHKFYREYSKRFLTLLLKHGTIFKDRPELNTLPSDPVNG